jgi:Family of unknown function (DUF5519)
MRNLIQQIQCQVTSWQGVTSSPHRFGGIEFRFGDAEIGHLHQGGTLDIPFPIPVRKQLLEEGLVEPHHYVPNSGWITFRATLDNVQRALWLLQLSYLRYQLKAKHKLEPVGGVQTEAFLALLDAMSLSPALRRVFLETVRLAQPETHAQTA